MLLSVMHAPSNLAYLQTASATCSVLGWPGGESAGSRQGRNGPGSQGCQGRCLSGRCRSNRQISEGGLRSVRQRHGYRPIAEHRCKDYPGCRTGQQPVLSTQTRTMDDVIPQINNFAQEINQKAFGRPSEGVQQAKGSEADDLANRNLSFSFRLAMSNDRISFINPNFIEVTPEASLRQPGIWKSQTSGGVTEWTLVMWMATGGKNCLDHL